MIKGGVIAAFFHHQGLHAVGQLINFLAVTGFNAFLNQGLQKPLVFVLGRCGRSVLQAQLADGFIGKQASVLKKAMGGQQNIEGGAVAVGFVEMMDDVVAGGRAQVQEVQDGGVWRQGVLGVAQHVLKADVEFVVEGIHDAQIGQALAFFVIADAGRGNAEPGGHFGLGEFMGFPELPEPGWKIG